MKGGVINTRHVAGTGWLVLLGLETERVHVDTLGWHVLVMLIRLNKVEVTTIALAEPIVTVELELGSGHWVSTVLEGHWEVNTVGTTSSHTGHGTGSGVGVVDKDGVGGGESTGGDVGHIKSIGVVEPLLTDVTTSFAGGTINVVIGLHNPDELLHGMIKI